MGVEDKFADEVMSDKELDKVAGGTNKEYKEILEYLPYVAYISNNPITTIFSQPKTYSYRLMNKDEVSNFLKEKLGIESKIDTGGWFSSGNPNTYTRNGKSLTHAQVIRELKDWMMS